MGFSFANRLRVQGTYLVLALLVMFVQTLHIQSAYLAFFAPDVLLALTFAWVLRRPDAMTPLLVAGVILLSDFLLHRPPALWTTVVVIATAVLGARAHEMRETMYSLEWGLVAAAVVGCFVSYQVLLIVTFSGPLPTGVMVTQIGTTILIYPIITFASGRLFGISIDATKDAPSGRYIP